MNKQTEAEEDVLLLVALPCHQGFLGLKGGQLKVFNLYHGGFVGDSLHRGAEFFSRSQQQMLISPILVQGQPLPS